MRQLNDWQQLQTLVGASEAYDLDFKGKYDEDDIEYAKDVCALANTFGGHIVVGASTLEKAFTCKGFHGIDRAEANRIADAIDDAVKSRCRPTPLFAARSIDIPGKESVVLVIEVHASQMAPVGVSTRLREGERLVQKAWLFPIRLGSQTEYLTPDQFGVLESMTARRAAALLNGIPAEERNRVVLRTSKLDEEATLEHVDPLRNTAHFKVSGAGGGFTAPLAVPLDEVATVWSAGEPTGGKWLVALRGRLDAHSFGSNLEYWPAG